MLTNSNLPVKYERKDVDARIIVYLCIAFCVCAIGIHFAIGALFNLYNTGQDSNNQMHTIASIQPPLPRLQTDPAADLQNLRAKERLQLSTYGWIDRQSETVHIPIGRAVDLVVERGLPDWQVKVNNLTDKKAAEPKQ
jgi:hypothetical protein